jgi:hypothetical protein
VGLRLGKDSVAIILTEKPRGVEIHFPPENLSQLQLKTGQTDKPDPGARFELNQYIHITVRAEIFTQN